MREFYNLVRAEPTADIAAADLTFSITPATAFPTPSAGNHIVLAIKSKTDKTKREIVHCTENAEGVLTVIRSQEGTVAPTLWVASDTEIIAPPTAAMMTDYDRSSLGVKPVIKLTDSGDIDLSSNIKYVIQPNATELLANLINEIDTSASPSSPVEKTFEFDIRLLGSSPLVSLVRGGETPVRLTPYDIHWQNNDKPPCLSNSGWLSNFSGYYIGDRMTVDGQTWEITDDTSPSGASEPSWPASPTVDVTTVVDGGVIWTYRGVAVDFAKYYGSLIARTFKIKLQLAHTDNTGQVYTGSYTAHDEYAPNAV